MNLIRSSNEVCKVKLGVCIFGITNFKFDSYYFEILDLDFLNS